MGMHFFLDILFYRRRSAFGTQAGKAPGTPRDLLKFVRKDNLTISLALGVVAVFFFSTPLGLREKQLRFSYRCKVYSKLGISLRIFFIVRNNFFQQPE